MKRNIIYFFIAAFISIVVPAPARFAYGIIVVLAVNFMVLFSILLKNAASFLNLSSMQSALFLTIIVVLTIVFKQLLILYSPVIALTLSFSLYTISFSSFVLGLSISDENSSLKKELSHSMKYSGLFSLVALPVFLFRDIFGYGTITFPCPSGLYIISLPSYMKSSPSLLWASISGALIILAFLLALAAWINQKFRVIQGIRNDAA